MESNIIEVTDAAEALAGLDHLGPWWAVLDAACWRPWVVGRPCPELGAERAMLVAASVAHGSSLGRWWRETDEDEEGTAVRMPSGDLLTPLGHTDAHATTALDAHAITSQLIDGTGANLTSTLGTFVYFDCARRHRVSVPESTDWGSTCEDLAALVCVLAWDLTMRRGSARHPPELVAGLSGAFALANLGIDPSIARHARAHIERPRCIDTTRWRSAITDDPELVLSSANDAEEIAEELLLPVMDHLAEPRPAPTGKRKAGRETSEEEPSQEELDNEDEEDPPRISSTTSHTLRQAIQTARVASNALAEDSRYATARG